MPPLGLNAANYNPQAATSLLGSDQTSLQGMDPMALLSSLFGGSAASGVQSPQATAAAGSPTAAGSPGGSTCSCGGNCAQGGACSCGCNASQRSNELGF